MTRLICLFFLLTGCVVLPTTKTQTRNAGTESSALTYGRIKSVALQTGASRTDVRVRALATRECQRQIFAVTEIKKTKHARLGVDDPRGRSLGIFLAPVTIPISAIITGIVLASSDESTTRVKKPLRTETTECSQDAGGYAVELAFPSGHTYRGKTDDNGVLVFAIPADEPYNGQVTVRGDQTVSEVHYEQKVPPVTLARDAIETCLAQAKLDGATLRLTINENGRATHIWLSAGDAKMHACVGTKIFGVVFPRSMRNATVVLPAAPTT